MCHCLLCEKRNSNTYSVHGYFPSEEVHVEGPTKTHPPAKAHLCSGSSATLPATSGVQRWSRRS
jgi:hypothetical protein